MTLDVDSLCARQLSVIKVRQEFSCMLAIHVMAPETRNRRPICLAFYWMAVATENFTSTVVFSSEFFGKRFLWKFVKKLRCGGIQLWDSQAL